MLNDFRPYSDPLNLKIIREVGSKVIQDVAPDEELTANRLMDRILQSYEQEQMLAVDNPSNEPGSFESIDLVTLIVVPLLVTTFGELCKQLVIWGIEDLKSHANTSPENKKKLSQMVDVFVEEKYEEVNKKVKSKKSRPKGKAIRDAVKIRIKNHLELE